MRRSCLLAFTAYLFGNAVPAHATFQPLHTGERACYQLTYQGQGTINVQGWLKQRADGGDHIQTRLQSQLEIVQIAPLRWAARLVAPHHRLEVNGAVQELNQAIASLTRPCYLALDAQGRIETIAFAPTTPASARSLMRSLMSNLVFACSEGAARRWTLQQDTADGPADVAYRALNKTTWEKRVVNYPLHRAIGLKDVPQMRRATQGALRFTFGRGHMGQGQMESVRGTLAMQMTLGGKPMSQEEEQFTLTRVGRDSAAPSVLKSLNADCQAISRQEKPTPLHVHDTNAAAQRASWTRVQGTTTPDSLQADLHGLDAAGAHNDPTAYSRLCALFHLQPALCEPFQRGFVVAPFDRLSARLVVAALGDVANSTQGDRHAEQMAQQTLRRSLSLYRDVPAAVMLLAPALSMAAVPDSETLPLLKSLSQSRQTDSAISCMLALGSLAQHSPRATSKAIARFLTARLATTDAAFHEPILAALGNAGSPEGLDALTNYTRHGSPALRGTAYMGLRFIPGARATALLYHGLRDADAGVRLNAARAFEFRPFTAADVRAFTGALAKESNGMVRLALLENLKLEAPYYPHVRPMLQRACKREASPEIRRTVAAWLHP